jgi:hypothetical protein
MKKTFTLAGIALASALGYVALPTTPPLTLTLAQVTTPTPTPTPTPLPNPKLKLTWSAVNVVNEEGFSVESAPAQTGPFAEIIGTIPRDSESWTDPNTPLGILKCYRVRSWNTLVTSTAGTTKQYSGYTNAVCGKTAFPPAAPGNLGVAQEAITLAMQNLEKSLAIISSHMAQEAPVAMQGAYRRGGVRLMQIAEQQDLAPAQEEQLKMQADKEKASNEELQEEQLKETEARKEETEPQNPPDPRFLENPQDKEPPPNPESSD